MPGNKIPKTLLVIGWTFLIISVLLIVSGILCLVVNLMFNRMPPDQRLELFESMAQDDPVSLLVLDYAGMLAFVQSLPAAVVLIISIFFLKLRAWARMGIEIVCWATIAYSIVALIIICTLWLSRIPVLAKYTTGANMVFSLALTIAAAVPLIFIIKYLRRSDIRRLFVGSGLNI
jgi:hypothetical protein